MAILTQEQLLKMPDEDYMNDAQLNYFRDLLKKEEKELLQVLEEARECLSNQETEADMADVATQQEIQQLHLRTVERQTRLLKKIRETLRRIDEGEYGYCEETGEAIGLRRLLARPTATLSIHAKEAQEYKERTEGEPEDYEES
jgi:DnaK suppressor protein